MGQARPGYTTKTVGNAQSGRRVRRYSFAMARPTTALIDLAAMRHNLALARSHAGPSMLWAVVKADAYGHGLDNAMRAFEAADGLALIEFDRAAWLRESGWHKPILMLEGPFDEADVDLAIKHRLSLAVHDHAHLEWIASRPGSGCVDLFLKFNSGMNRLGFDADGLRRAHARALSLAQVGRVTLMTHFANADLPAGAEQSLARFDAACEGLDAPQCTSNSAAVLWLAHTHRDAVRPGIMLYGASPFASQSAAALGLRSAMTLRSELISVQTLAAGDAVGYGSSFVAQAPMRIGVVACGYADGYPRSAPTGTPVLVEGVRTRLVGRVSMDMLTVDLSQIPRADVGSPVELWGDKLPIDEVATCAGTIGYELMCALAPRVVREVKD